jgi:thymidylate synthase (FAD)
MSWQAYDPKKPRATNPNVTKVREGNETYIKNILSSGHGSVLEHCTATFVLNDVSRVLTHEICRHRAGMAFSQQSLRYIRLDDLGFWLPPQVVADEVLSKIFVETVNTLEGIQRRLAEHTGIDGVKNFHLKKQLTSMFRRLAPIGTATSIMVTGNLRSWRHVIAQRTSLGAEEEIRMVIGKAARILLGRYPNVFSDMVEHEDGSFTFEHAKVG